MAEDYFYHNSGQTFGPMSAKQLRQHALTGKVTRDGFVRLGSEGSWVPATTLQGLFEPPSTPIPMATAAPIPMATAVPIPKATALITGLNLTGNDDLPPPPDYGFVETVAIMYNIMGVVTLIGSFIAILIFAAMDVGRKDEAGQRFASFIGIIIFGAIASITCFAMAQLFTMAINGSKNLHYIMHSNMVAMRVIVNQFSKKE
jgi:hypothetical protein